MRALFLIFTFSFLIAAALNAQQPQPQRPVFETKAELVLVDVNVVDRESKPVTTLTPADFQLEVNGQPRPIASIQFISTAPTNATPSTPRETASTSNETETTGRLLLFVVDESSLRVGSSRSLLRTAQILFDRLAPGDHGRPGENSHRRRRRRVHRGSQAHYRRPDARHRGSAAIASA